MKKGLGKGLGALLSREGSDENQNNVFENSQHNQKEEVFYINIDKIQIDRLQPRKNFDQENIEELAKSIKEVGVINPIIVKKNGEFYQIVSGERRFRACKFLNLKQVPVLVRNFTELKKLEVALIENVQRQNLNPIEEALVYKKFQEEFSLNHEEIAEKIGKSRASISNSIRLLKLDDRVKQFIIDGKISIGHAKVILSLSDKNLQFQICEKIIKESLSVRQTEVLIKKYAENNKNKKEENIIDTAKKYIFEEISNKLNHIFGTKVNIKDKNDKGKIEIEYYSQDELQRIIELFEKI